MMQVMTKGKVASEVEWPTCLLSINKHSQQHYANYRRKGYLHRHSRRTESSRFKAGHIANGLKRPHLAAIIVGNNPASRAYVGHKIKACEYVGFESTLVELPETLIKKNLNRRLKNSTKIDHRRIHCATSSS